MGGGASGTSGASSRAPPRRQATMRSAEPEATRPTPQAGSLAEAERLEAQGRTGEAEALCRMLAGTAAAPGANLILGRLAIKRGALAEAITRLRRAGALEPGDP